MSVAANLMASYSRRRFACLFFSLIMTMAAAPVFGALGFGGKFIEILLGMNILAATLITLHSHRLYAGLGLFVLFLGLRILHTIQGSGALLLTGHGIGVVICLVSVSTIIRHILREKSVDSEHIFAALDVYLLIGIICGLLFFIFEEKWPGSISFHGLVSIGKDAQLEYTIYFSFVTLGTLGYGDMLPISGPARALAVTEALVGQMYLVVVVARLVSLYKGGSECNEGDRDKPANRADDFEQL